MKIIKIKDFISNFPTRDNGQAVLREILNSNEDVELDFADCRIAYTGFFQEIFGVLAKNYPNNGLVFDHIWFKNLNIGDSNTILLVIKHTTNKNAVFLDRQIKI